MASWYIRECETDAAGSGELERLVPKPFLIIINYAAALYICTSILSAFGSGRELGIRFLGMGVDRGGTQKPQHGLTDATWRAETIFEERLT
jgi:hypothetical protein